MFQVDKLWMQRGLDALEEMFRVDDATKRDMIQFLFDEGFWDSSSLKWSAAVVRFNDCLNPGKDRFFKLAELWALAKAFHRHQLLHAMAEDLGYYPVRERPSEERRQELLARIAAAEERMLAGVLDAKRELGLLGEAPSTPRMHPAIREGRGSFSVSGKDTLDTRKESEGSTAKPAAGGF